MRFKAKQKKVLLFIVAISIILFAFFNWQNNSIIISEMVFKNDTIPEAFKGYKILQISDLHNKEFEVNKIKYWQNRKDKSRYNSCYRGFN